MDLRRMALLDRLSTAAADFAALADRLATSAGIRSPEYHELLRRTKLAHAEVDRARAEFEQHREQHCVS